MSNINSNSYTGKNEKYDHFWFFDVTPANLQRPKWFCVCPDPSRVE